MEFFNKKTFRLIFIFGILMWIVIWYIWASYPLSVRQVTRVLNRYIENQEFVHIATEREGYSSFWGTHIYLFRDRDGIEFTVMSRVRGSDIAYIPRHDPLHSDYLVAHAIANQNYIIDLLTQTGLDVRWEYYRDDNRLARGFVMTVHSYDDLEPASRAIANTLNSVDCVLSTSRSYAAQNDILFHYPRVYVRHVNGSCIFPFRFLPLGGTDDLMCSQEVFEQLHNTYLERIRLGWIEEELSEEIWWQSPRHIFNIYFNGELIRGGENRINESLPYLFYNQEYEEYRIGLFGIVAWYVDKMGGSYDFVDLSDFEPFYDFGKLDDTWTIGTDTWIATIYRKVTEYPRGSRSVIRIAQVTKNGESLGIYDIDSGVTLPYLAKILGLDYEIDQTTAAVYFWSSD